jgi:hypothetical protein
MLDVGRWRRKGIKSMNSRIACLTVALLALLPSTARGQMSTTTPSSRVTIVVRITDRGITPLSAFAALSTTVVQAMPQASRVPRGDYVTFNVFNEGKRPHNFTFLGRRTPIIRPGGRASFNVYLKRRGTFRYASTVDRGKKFGGILTVV